ncbi:hypothetical protein ACNSPD_07920 [Yersinia enterocolitica]|uniref:hypothetical protein n=1 Tax=Yersinia enterocolitica TaxID=630 RepID=UPI003AB649D8
MFVQFNDSTKEEIITYFDGPQDSKDYPNQGEVEADDPKWAVFYGKVHMWMDGLPEPTRNTA